MNLPTSAVHREFPRYITWTAHVCLAIALLGVLILSVRRRVDDTALRPARDDEVLAHVPVRNSAAGRELLALEQRVRAAPHDLTAALVLAHAQIKRARDEGDPRFMGEAEATIAPFFAQAFTPGELWLLRATIRQSRHEFNAALADLQQALARTPGDAQAWLTRASILTVLGRYGEARESCAPLVQLTHGVVATACRAQIDAITGQAEQAHAALEAELAHVRSRDDAAWLLSLLGETDVWLGHPERAERALREALSLAPDDRYTRGLMADLLLDDRRAHEVSGLLRGRTLDDGLLLRAALAARAIDSGEADTLMASAEQRLQANRLRGDAVHQREEARLALALGRTREALERARENFSVQHEAWDVRLLLEAALACSDVEAAAPALTWLRETRNESPRLSSLAQRLKELN